MNCPLSGILFADDVGLCFPLAWVFVGGGTLPMGA
jgi:hypothetical protein